MQCEVRGRRCGREVHAILVGDDVTVFVDGQEYAIGVWSLLGGYVVYPRGIEVNWYYLDLVDSMLRMETKFEVVRKTLEHPGLISSGASLVSLVEGRDG